MAAPGECLGKLESAIRPRELLGPGFNSGILLSRRGVSTVGTTATPVDAATTYNSITTDSCGPNPNACVMSDLHEVGVDEHSDLANKAVTGPARSRGSESSTPTRILSFNWCQEVRETRLFTTG
jgi:hypothetical protein